MRGSITCEPCDGFIRSKSYQLHTYEGIPDVHLLGIIHHASALDATLDEAHLLSRLEKLLERQPHLQHIRDESNLFGESHVYSREELSAQLQGRLNAIGKHAGAKDMRQFTAAYPAIMQAWAALDEAMPPC